MSTKRRLEADAASDDPATRLRMAVSPLALGASTPSLRSLADAACLPMMSAQDVVIITDSSNEVIRLGKPSAGGGQGQDLHAILEASAADCEARMSLASDAASSRLAKVSDTPSVYELVQVICDECVAVGLVERRHGARLALETVLAQSHPERAKDLAAALQRELGCDQQHGGAARRVLALLRVACECHGGAVLKEED